MRIRKWVRFFFKKKVVYKRLVTWFNLAMFGQWPNIVTVTVLSSTWTCLWNSEWRSSSIPNYSSLLIANLYTPTRLESLCLPYYDKLLMDEEVFWTKFQYFEIIEGSRTCLKVFSMEITSRESCFVQDLICWQHFGCRTAEFDPRYHPPRGVCSNQTLHLTLQYTENILGPNPLSSVLR